MGVQEHVTPDGRDVLEGLRRHRQPVPDAAAVHDDVIPAAHRDLPRDERDHAVTPATARASGEWLRWQTATARASETWSGVGGAARPSRRVTMRATWALSARPLAHTAPLTCCGV